MSTQTIRTTVRRNAAGKQEIRSRNAIALMGRAPDGNDADDAFRAGELLLGALGACTAGTVSAYARNHGITALQDVIIEVIGEEVGSPSRIAGIEIVLTLVGDLSSAEREKLQRVATSCKIHNTLKHPPQIAIAVAAPETASA
ncbi:hypothetical protein IGB42_00214 [Andreprevotia sp. IGB-42]|uniref:OsmC family protein n=1 Tax=Andreprevotia sp. IGB-42 TaxID=2497473 RepID=UPI00135AE91C|nr:OsmC family protein [Andreprevotia sp. IGB-42]KAF0815137.1 hypothetical protein IGB42_00214 [Andreprevotia sp. IGB-42]